MYVQYSTAAERLACLSWSRAAAELLAAPKNNDFYFDKFYSEILPKFCQIWKICQTKKKKIYNHPFIGELEKLVTLAITNNLQQVTIDSITFLKINSFFKPIICITELL